MGTDLIWCLEYAIRLNNGSLSPSFDLSRSSLSPMLFTMAFEILALWLQKIPEVVGLTSNGRSSKLMLYANILDLFLSPSLSAALQAVNIFGEFSELTINGNESVIYPRDNSLDPKYTIVLTHHYTY